MTTTCPICRAPADECGASHLVATTGERIGFAITFGLMALLVVLSIYHSLAGTGID